MASDDVDNFLTRLSRKRARDEEENRDKMSIFLGTIISVIAVVVAWYNETYLVKEPSRDWDQERRCYLNRLYNGREVDCIEQLRVSKNAFKSLCTILHGKGGLTPTRNVSIEESVAVFLNILAHNLKFRVDQKEKSGSGALDETHIPVTVSAEDRPRYRNRKGDISTNVLGVCDPDLKFIYVLSGWEGSTSDARILRDALARDNLFQVPSDKYYLVDAGYANGQGFLAPYRGTRYHLNEWPGNNRPETYKELFNLRHSIARNVIERSFGLLKKRWSILRTPSFFNIKTQLRIINACFVLHNFIRLEQHNDPVLQDQDLGFLASVDHEISNHSTLEGNANRITSVQVTDQWTTFRDTLAMQMFHDYQARGTTIS
ncbi:hypothetical protein CerSpe_213480 [Prunus speciosa]